MSFSMFGGDSPPRGAKLPSFNYLQRNLPVFIEQNVSYTRSGQQAGPRPEKPQHGLSSGLHISHERPSNDSRSASSSVQNGPRNQNSQNSQNGQNGQNGPNIPTGSNEPEVPQTEEDARFLRLAHDALVATSKESNLIVDPTIQDLLQRLQYALSPHGNPIKRLDSIRANENGQLMIQSFYNGFPNLSNDIFTGSNNPSNTENPGWNFLIDKKSPAASVSPEPVDSSGELTGRLKEERKFPCRSCSMSFRRSSDLKRHEKQHLLVPANICPQCGKGFARKDALKRHLGTLTCKRNADKKLYHKNLQYLKDQDSWDD